MSKVLKSLFLLGTLAISLAATPARATPFSFTVYGTISQGYDADGIFGNAHSPLDGEFFSQTISFDTSINAHNDSLTDSSTSYGDVGSTLANISTTVNSHTFSTTVTSTTVGLYASVNSFLSHHGGDPDFSWSDWVYGSVCGTASDGQFDCAWQSVWSSSNPFLPSSALDQGLSYILQEGDTYNANFYTSGDNGTADFAGYVSSFTLNGGSEVPEPETLALFALGLFAAAAVRRRKKS